ncbi:sulfatase family protein [Ktedonosporobacter rubrisoli]|uniref:sulfatase family protein n=1 Tax=Ktedonosporobacter rubrisoli TaxID=2509675 RepID=UPI0013EEC7C2|nr:sulfatase [Ktedonosporobacter rubrisoli]
MRIIYIDIDSCRPDHLSCYGYPRPTSPVIDSLAQQGVLFRNCHTSDAPCLPSRAALFSGRLGINNGVTCHDGPASQLRYAGRGHFHDPTRPMWMRYLQKAGWETVCFSGFGQRHLAWWFFSGFTQNFGNQLPGESETADEVTEKVLHWLQQNGTTDNWFMHVNYWDVHHPYEAPERYFQRIRDLPCLPYPNAESIAYDVQHYYGPRTARDWWYESGWQNAQEGRRRAMPRGNPDTYENYKGFVDGHDAGIAYIDEKLGTILEALEKLGVRDETAIIVGSDHGESIGELGMYFEHGNACEGTTHVPLIIYWPGITDQAERSVESRAIDTLMYQLDLAPTMLDLLGMELPTNWDGISLASQVRGSVGPTRDHLVLGCGIYSFQRAVRTERYRLIRTIHSGLYPYEPLYLFDMQNDPYQTQNIATEQPEIVAQLDHLLLAWLWQYTTGSEGVRDPFQEQLRAGITPDIYCPRWRIEERLQALGRDDQLADLRAHRDKKPALRPW